MCEPSWPMKRTAKRMLMAAVLCAALATAAVAIALSTGSHGTGHVASSGPRHIAARSRTIYAQPQYSITRNSTKSSP